MSATDWSKVIAGIESVDLSCAPVDVVQSTIASASRAQAWLEGVMVDATRRLRELSATDPRISPVHTFADASGTDLRPADRVVRRAETAEQVPALADALRAGQASAAHVDVMARTLAGLDAGEQQALIGQQSTLAKRATQTTPNEFRRLLSAEVRRLRRNDGIERFERQRRAVRLRTWWDADDGMFHVRGQFDPETGMLLDAAIGQRVEALFHAALPVTCPADPGERHAHLCGLALADLIAKSGGVEARSTVQTTVSVLIDEQTLRHGLHQHSVCQGHTLEADLPIETVRRLACDAAILPMVLNGEGIVLDVGRGQRLATPMQRAALAAMYSTCALCDTPFRRCKIHHLQYWEEGGETNLDNLVPLCFHHHHCAHEGGWALSLDPQTRTLTAVRPDGVSRCTSPSRARSDESVRVA